VAIIKQLLTKQFSINAKSIKKQNAMQVVLENVTDYAY